MKYFAIFAAVLGVAMALPTSSVWTLEQLSEALDNPNIDQTLIPYLEEALNKLMASIFSGNNVNAILVEFPEVTVKPTPVIPEYVPVPSASSSPLVQLIINVNNRNEVVGSPVAPEVIPTPVEIAESPEYEDIAVGPAIVEQPEVITNPVDIMNPIVVAPPEDKPEPEVISNPVDIMNPIVVSPPEDKPEPEVISNPVDIMNPIVVSPPENKPEPEVVSNPVDIMNPIVVSPPEDKPEVISNPVDIMNPIVVSPVDDAIDGFRV